MRNQSPRHTSAKGVCRQQETAPAGAWWLARWCVELPCVLKPHAPHAACRTDNSGRVCSATHPRFHGRCFTRRTYSVTTCRASASTGTHSSALPVYSHICKQHRTTRACTMQQDPLTHHMVTDLAAAPSIHLRTGVTHAVATGTIRHIRSKCPNCN